MNKFLTDELLKEWDYELNMITPQEAKGPDKIWWKCFNEREHKHSYQRALNTKPILKGCPYCAGRKILQGFNDLASQYPYLLEEWDYNKNFVKPEEIGKNYSKKVSWIDKHGHSWEALVSP